jgi:hypothetical protein
VSVAMQTPYYSKLSKAYSENSVSFTPVGVYIGTKRLVVEFEKRLDLEKRSHLHQEV